MIKSVTVTNYLGESLKIEMTRPESSGFYIQKIEGLGPCTTNINITERASMDGSRYSSAHVNTRNIIMSLGFSSTYDIEELRHKSYKYFPIKRKVKILIETDRRICETYGYVESNEPDIFSPTETTQISILCPDPYFYSSGEGAVSFVALVGIEPEFSFYFSNESLTENEIVFGEIQNNVERIVPYYGETEVGIRIHIHALGAASNVSINNVLTRETMKIDTSRLKILTGHEIIAGDDIIISTVIGEKSIQLIRNGICYNILNCVDRHSDWFQLSTGDNLFACKADDGAENLQITIEHKTTYEGV